MKPKKRFLRHDSAPLTEAMIQFFAADHRDSEKIMKSIKTTERAVVCEDPEIISNLRDALTPFIDLFAAEIKASRILLFYVFEKAPPLADAGGCTYFHQNRAERAVSIGILRDVVERGGDMFACAFLHELAHAFGPWNAPTETAHDDEFMGRLQALIDRWNTMTGADIKLGDCLAISL